MNVIITLNPGIGEDLGPDFLLTSDVDGWSDTTTDIELYAGVEVTVPDEATVVYIQSLGLCFNILTLPIEETTTTTSSTSTTTTSTTEIPETTTTTTTEIPVTTTTTTTEDPLISMVLMVGGTSDGKVYSYSPLTDELIELFSVGNSGTDIAHTSNKLWVKNASYCYEYNITLSPFSQTFSRMVSGIGSSPALDAINDTTLVNVTENSVNEYDITTTTSVTTKFTTMSGRIVAGDVVLTTNGKLIYLTYDFYDSTIKYITQYDYITGTLEFDKSWTGTPSPFGIYQHLGVIYIVMSGGQIYSILTTSPYTMTLVKELGIAINGASQIPSYSTASFMPNITTTTTTTEG